MSIVLGLSILAVFAFFIIATTLVLIYKYYSQSNKLKKLHKSEEIATKSKPKKTTKFPMDIPLHRPVPPPYPSTRPFIGQNISWDPSLWTPVNDTIRGGESTSHIALLPDNKLKFFGNLVKNAKIGNAGFASQRLDVRKFVGQCGKLNVVGVGVENTFVDINSNVKLDWNDTKGLLFTLQSNQTPNLIFSINLKTEEETKRDDGRVVSTIEFKAAFKGRQSNIGNSESYLLRWEEFVPFYRGKKVEDNGSRKNALASDMEKGLVAGSTVAVPKLDPSEIKYLSIMCQTYFGNQSGYFDVLLDRIDLIFKQLLQTPDAFINEINHDISQFPENAEKLLSVRDSVSELTLLQVGASHNNLHVTTNCRIGSNVNIDIAHDSSTYQDHLHPLVYRSPAGLACIHGHCDVVVYLVGTRRAVFKVPSSTGIPRFIVGQREDSDTDVDFEMSFEYPPLVESVERIRGVNFSYSLHINESFSCEQLFPSARYGHAKIVSHLISCGADLQIELDVNNSAVFAAAHNHLEVLEVLVAKNMTFEVDSNRLPNDIIYAAVSQGHIDVVKHILENPLSGSNIDPKSYPLTLIDYEELIDAAIDQKNDQLFQLMLDIESDIYRSEYHLVESIFHASAANFVQILNHPSSDEFKDKLLAATLCDYRRHKNSTSSSFVENVETLLKWGAPVNLDDGIVPATDTSIRAQGSQSGIYPPEPFEEVVHLTYIDRKDKSAFPEVTALLLEHMDFDIDWGDGNRRTLLHHAAKDGQFELLAYMVSNGAEIIIMDGEGNIPMWLAVKGNDLKTVSYCLNIEPELADVGIPTQSNKLPIELIYPSNEPESLAQFTKMAELTEDQRIVWTAINEIIGKKLLYSPNILAEYIPLLERFEYIAKELINHHIDELGYLGA
ncbi:hypothetical protein HK098_000352 [Nowakowskiella sp. JEL0407]|nr:hypothetical protein HK098_000352 [Nowakowskiella sp. JEL0407]